jgi:hypothetical protein
MKRNILRFATTLAVVAAGVGSAPLAANAAGCSGASCVHQEPNAQGCSGTTVASVRPPGGGPLILLRWSAGCVANWARFDDSNLSAYSPGYWTYWVETGDGHREDKLFNQTMWTYMVNVNLLARVCVQNEFAQRACTTWK